MLFVWTALFSLESKAATIEDLNAAYLSDECIQLAHVCAIQPYYATIVLNTLVSNGIRQRLIHIAELNVEIVVIVG